jgi:hypothetical protein
VTKEPFVNAADMMVVKGKVVAGDGDITLPLGVWMISSVAARLVLSDLEV